MYIAITSPSVGYSGSTAFILADDTVNPVTATTWPNGAGGQIKEGFINKQKRSVQSAALFRGASALVLPRYNLCNRFSFTVQRSFSTVENCIAFIAFHPDSVPVQGEITLDNQSATGLIKRYLPNAVVEAIECVKHQGLSCDFQYTIAGTGPWQSSP